MVGSRLGRQERVMGKVDYNQYIMYLPVNITMKHTTLRKKIY